MHLPVGLGQMFVINYLVSHFSLSIVVAVPAMIGLALGLAFGRGPGMALLVPLALAMMALPFHAETFDVVVSNVAIHNIKDRIGRTAAVDEAVRVLRPGGRLLLADLSGTRAYERRLVGLGMVTRDEALAALLSLDPAPVLVNRTGKSNSLRISTSISVRPKNSSSRPTRSHPTPTAA